MYKDQFRKFTAESPGRGASNERENQLEYYDQGPDAQQEYAQDQDVS